MFLRWRKYELSCSRLWNHVVLRVDPTKMHEVTMQNIKTKISSELYHPYDKKINPQPEFRKGS